MTVREQVFLTGVGVAVPLLAAWVRVTLWEWQARR